MTLGVDIRMLHSSGIGTYLQNLLPALSQDIDLILIGHSSEADLPYGRVIITDIPIYSLAELRKLASLIPPCDVFWSPHYNVPLLPIRAKKRLVTIHDVFHLAFFQTLSLKQKVYARLMFRAAVRNSASIITVSEFSRTEITKYLNVAPARINVIPNGINHVLFRVIEENGTLRAVRQTYQLPEKFILYVGNVKPHKNLLTLVKAFAKLPAAFESYHLVIVGKKEGFVTGDTVLHDFIRQNESLASRVHFTGFVAEEDLPVLYNLARLFVFPSYYEGFGLPPLEAMACGCPVMTSDRASMPEICRNAAVYVSPDDAEAMADRMQKMLLLSDTARQQMIQAGQQRAQRYTWAQSIRQHRQLIQELSD